ncbi:MAG: MXAN_6640 family putative metalloprotease, partial [Candidatus Neomarinimicrobiota bacterium]
MRTGAISAVVAALLAGIATADAAQRPVKCGWGHYQEQTLDRSALASAKRPDLDTAYVTLGGTFAVHYDTSGLHSPDLSSTRVEGTPDWVIDVAAALDAARALLLDLGYLSATPDEDGIYDLYLQEYGGIVYGETYFRDSIGQIMPPYTVMDNDFAHDEIYYTHGIDAARVTVAHEYFHAVQLAYGWRAGDAFFYELSSTWFEEVAFPDVNDWVFWFHDIDPPPFNIPFGNEPTQNIAQTNGYSAAIFGHYLTQTFGLLSMTAVWSDLIAQGSVAALEAELDDHASSLTVAWTDFVARLFLNGRDASTYFQADQELLASPDAGDAQLLVGASSLTFADLSPAAAGVQALALDGPANLEVRIVSAPATHAARMVLGRVGGNFSHQRLTKETWY